MEEKGKDHIILSEGEKEFLERLAGKIQPGREYSVEALAGIAGLEKSSVEALVRLLSSKNLASLRVVRREEWKPSREALAYLKEGFPEERLVSLLRKRGGEASIEDVRRELGDEIAEKALVNASRKKWVRIERGIIKLVEATPLNEERRALENLVEKGEPPSPSMLKILRKRRLVERTERRETLVKFHYAPEEILEKALVTLGALTRDHIVSGLWRRAVLREYNVAAEPPRRYPNRLHFFREFIDFIKDVMREMGFVEYETGPVEIELWNYDVLFQPQFHPARSPTDTFYLETPSRGRGEEQIVERAKRIHEEKWKYTWSEEKALRPILRSHTTPTSARILYALKPEPPFRYFTIGRVYRVETIDSRHLLEFHQLDGIASEDGISFSSLLGLLSEFFERIGIKEYKFRPAYFPFTEPSAEASVRIAGQWIEVLGCGMFRPEVLEAVGVDYPVAAWGMGLERIAMAVYGISDIRQLYTFDLERIKSTPIRWWVYAGSSI